MPKSDMAMSLYQEPLVYEALFNPGLADLPHYRAWGQACQGTLLELGCGTGRLLWPLKKTGLAVEGLDAEKAMLEACRAEGLRQGLDAPLHLGDWLTFDLGRRFAGVYFPFNGLQHLHRAEDLDAFFERLRAHLLPGGAFAFDVHLPQPAILARDPRERYGVEDPARGPGGERVIAEQSVYDAQAQVLTQMWTLGLEDGSTRELSLGLRQFFPQELQRLLKTQGFEVVTNDTNAFKQVICTRYR